MIAIYLCYPKCVSAYIFDIKQLFKADAEGGNMKKRLLALLMATAMTAMCLTGCGSSSEEEKTEEA